jgi:hypothetical protein
MMTSIIPLLPPHNHFISVFGGSGAEILNKPPSRLETYNDADGHLYRLFKLLRDGDVDELKRRLECTPSACRRTYLEAHSLLNSEDPIISSWAFLVLSHQGFTLSAPAMQAKRDWRYIYNYSTPEYEAALAGWTRIDTNRPESPVGRHGLTPRAAMAIGDHSTHEREVVWIKPHQTIAAPTWAV